MSKWKNTSNHWSKTDKREEVLGKVMKYLKRDGGMRGKKHTQAAIRKMSKNRKGKGLWSGKEKRNFPTGENHPNWKGGITSEQARIRQSLEYKIWAKEVYQRDYWTCRLCEKKCRGDIVAHHLKLFADFPELRFSIDNGITLCRSCHKKVHKDIGKETRFKKH